MATGPLGLNSSSSVERPARASPQAEIDWVVACGLLTPAADFQLFFLLLDPPAHIAQWLQATWLLLEPLIKKSCTIQRLSNFWLKKIEKNIKKFWKFFLYIPTNIIHFPHQIFIQTHLLPIFFTFHTKFSSLSKFHLC